jgi:hypothetical protein
MTRTIKRISRPGRWPPLFIAGVEKSVAPNMTSERHRGIVIHRLPAAR